MNYLEVFCLILYCIEMSSCLLLLISSWILLFSESTFCIVSITLNIWGSFYHTGHAYPGKCPMMLCRFCFVEASLYVSWVLFNGCAVHIFYILLGVLCVVVLSVAEKGDTEFCTYNCAISSFVFQFSVFVSYILRVLLGA